MLPITLENACGSYRSNILYSFQELIKKTQPANNKKNQKKWGFESILYCGIFMAAGIWKTNYVYRNFYSSFLAFKVG